MKHILRIILYLFNVFIKIIIFFVSLALQIYVLWLSVYSVPHYYPLYAVTILVSFIPITYVFNSSNNSSYKMSWIILILVLPIVGMIMYLFFGQGRSFSKKRALKLKEYVTPYVQKNDTLLYIRHNTDKKIANLLHATSKLPFYIDDQVTFLNDGAIWFEKMMEDIQKAKKYVFLEYFIFSDGETLERLSSLLIQKAQEGVQIKIILDDIGSKKGLKQKTIDRLKEHPNLKVYSFNPMGMFFSLNLNFRNHRKMTIIDGKIAYCGGTNIADEYVHKKDRFGFWRDNACRYAGSAVNSFVFTFCIDWFMSAKEKLKMDEYFYDHPQIPSSKESYICPFSDGPGDDDNPGYTLFQSMIENAKYSIYISTPYFIIDREFIGSLENAAKSGIDVRLLIPHIPDKKIPYIMTYYHVGRLIKSGVKVYRYTPGFTHAKNIIIDDKYTFNGTFNLDYRSLFLHFECGAFHINKDLAKEMKDDFHQALKKCRQFSYQEWKKRPVYYRIIEFLGSLFAPLL